MARINSNNTNLLNIQDYHQRKLFAKEKQVTPNGKYRVFFLLVPPRKVLSTELVPPNREKLLSSPKMAKIPT